MGYAHLSTNMKQKMCHLVNTRAVSRERSPVTFIFTTLRPFYKFLKMQCDDVGIKEVPLNDIINPITAVHHFKRITDKYPLFNEINNFSGNNHVCIHNEHACQFCLKKVRIKTDPPPNKKVIYFLPSEVALHNKPDDCWISFLGNVFDVTPVLSAHVGESCTRPLIAFAGKDVSHWFNDEGQLRHHVHPVTGVYVPYCPYGLLPDVNIEVPATSWEASPDPPWWKNPKYKIGFVTKKARKIKIMNMLTKYFCSIEVCMEDELRRIQERYHMFNSDKDSYTWCYEDRVLELDKTLKENGIPDDRETFTDVGLPEDTYVPMILLYYNDDLKWELHEK